MNNGIIKFEKPDECQMREMVREMKPKEFGLGENVAAVEAELADWGAE
jgi:hypothetical protein